MFRNQHSKVFGSAAKTWFIQNLNLFIKIKVFLYIFRCLDKLILKINFK
jgi:hypothetical protein